MASCRYWHPIYYDPYWIFYWYHYFQWRCRVSLPQMSSHQTGNLMVFPFLLSDFFSYLILFSYSRKSSLQAFLELLIWLRVPQLQSSLAAREREKAWRVPFILFDASNRDYGFNTYFRLLNWICMIVWHLLVWANDETVCISSYLTLSEQPITSSCDFSDDWRHL